MHVHVKLQVCRIIRRIAHVTLMYVLGLCHTAACIEWRWGFVGATSNGILGISHYLGLIILLSTHSSKPKLLSLTVSNKCYNTKTPNPNP